jgi:eukaryotic-like serine/threonine-protein kinase
MALARGSRIGEYEILELLGRGGMGEVYRARDTELQRDVAIKILAPSFASDPDRLARFTREAQVLASLNHPNIATIHGVEDATGAGQAGVRAIVLELVEGETLADWLMRGPLRLAEAVGTARQIADALAAAHEQGIVHRDLKPANIKITASGVVKLLDFGLAKSLDAGDEALDRSDAPTVYGRTRAGMILGTAAYMSPEQARGQALDGRADVWSLGCVLFEMLTGRAAFGGATFADTVAAILERQPDWDALPAHTPASVRRVLQRCLEKDPKRRLHHVADARLELDDLLAEPGAATMPAVSRPRVAWRWLAVLLLLSAAWGIAALTIGANPATWWQGLTGGPDPGGIEAIAVLPLENLSRDPDQEYFADGMTDELITELARIRALRVISRTSTMRYKQSTKNLQEIGSELNVDAVIEGSVLRAGGQARITLKLVEVATERTLLAESYARELQDVLALQSQIARAVADQVRVTVSPPEQTRLERRVVPAAYDDYLKGRSLWARRTPEGVQQALVLFQRAIAADPSFASAWSGIADCYIVFQGALLGLSEREAYPKAREAAMKALALDDTLAEAHTSLASIKGDYDWDWAGAEAEYRRAIDLNPSYATARQWYGEFLSPQRRHSEAIEQARRARELDPFAPAPNVSLAAAYARAGREDDALEQLKRTLQIDPNIAGVHFYLGQLYLRRGLHAQAIEELERAFSLTPGVRKVRAALGHAYAVQGQPEKARQVLSELQQAAARTFVSPYDVALIHVGLGDSDQAFAWLEKAYQARSYELVGLNVDWQVDPLRGDPRFADLVRRIGLRSQ